MYISVYFESGSFLGCGWITWAENAYSQTCMVTENVTNLGGDILSRVSPHSSRGKSASDGQVWHQWPLFFSIFPLTRAKIVFHWKFVINPIRCWWERASVFTQVSGYSHPFMMLLHVVVISCHGQWLVVIKLYLESYELVKLQKGLKSINSENLRADCIASSRKKIEMLRKVIIFANHLGLVDSCSSFSCLTSGLRSVLENAYVLRNLSLHALRFHCIF